MEMAENTKELSIKMHVYVEIDKKLTEQEEQALVDEMTKHIESKEGKTIYTQVHEFEQQEI